MSVCLSESVNGIKSDIYLLVLPDTVHFSDVVDRDVTSSTSCCVLGVPPLAISTHSQAHHCCRHTTGTLINPLTPTVAIRVQL